jgi:hypothetical protein
MVAPFPAIKPTGRSFRIGQFPTKVYRALSGFTVKRSFGNRAYGFELQLEFKNVGNGATSEILKHYTETSGGFVRFTLPNEVFAGLSAATQGYIQSSATIGWEYSGAPDVKSVRGGVIDVQVSLIGELI